MEACRILLDEETMAGGKLRARAPSTRVLSDAGGLLLQGRKRVEVVGQGGGSCRRASCD